MREKMPILVASHVAGGSWSFECPLHAAPNGTYGLSTPVHALAVLKAHLDAAHPGTTARLKIETAHNGTKRITYTSTENVIRTL